MFDEDGSAINAERESLCSGQFAQVIHDARGPAREVQLHAVAHALLGSRFGRSAWRCLIA